MEVVKKQVVFLVDTNLFLENNIQCPVCTRILFFLSKFPDKDYNTRVKWNYKLFSSGKPFTSTRTKIAQFKEINSEDLENFYKHLSSIQKEPSGFCSNGNACWSKAIYDALISTVHDFLWDAIEISSPMRRPRLQHGGWNGGRKKDVSISPSSSRNMIFMFCGDPPDSSDVKDTHREIDGDEAGLTALLDKTLPKPLLTELRSRKMQLYWVYTGQRNSHNLRLLSRMLKLIGVTLIPVNVLLNTSSLPSSLRPRTALVSKDITDCASVGGFLPVPPVLGGGGVAGVSSLPVLPPECLFEEYLRGLEQGPKEGKEIYSVYTENSSFICMLQLEDIYKHKRETGKVPSIAGDSHVILESSQATHVHTSIPTDKQMLALGLINQLGVSLKWLDLASTRACSGHCHTSDDCEQLHSKQYQNLCVWLASNKCFMLMEVSKEDTRHLALLQPITSLTSTLTFIKPCYNTNLRTLLVDPPLQSKEVSPIMAALSTSIEEFSFVSLYPWFPYTQASGVKSSSAFRLLQDLILDSKDDELEKPHQNLLPALKELYADPSIQHASANIKFRGGDVQAGEKEKEGEDDDGNNNTTLVPSSISDECPEASSEEELFDWFEDEYEKCLADSLAMDFNVDKLYRWVSVRLPQLLHHFRKFVAYREGTSSLFALFWSQLSCRVLCSSSQLSTKHGVEAGGKSVDDFKKEINEYLLQVLLHFEGLKLCSENVETDSVALKVTGLCRKVSLLSDPGLLGSFMQKLVLPMYVSSHCRGLLIEVYENLMLPLPSDIQESSPESSPLGRGIEDEEEEASELERDLMSLEEPLAPKAQERNKRRLIRHRSFHDVSMQQRMIFVPPQKQKQKTKHKDLLVDEKFNLRRSPRIEKLRDASKKGKSVCRSLFSRSQTVGGITRTKRAEQVDGKIRGRKSKSSRKLDILVKETPVKKQVEADYHLFKQERLRSKSSLPCSPGVRVISESPRRSFYSISKRKNLTPKFKTPEVSVSITKLAVGSSMPLIKDLSPSAIHSLLHDRFTSPSTSSTTLTTSPLTKATRINHIAESPELFGNYKGDIVPLSSTPKKSRTSRDMDILPNSTPKKSRQWKTSQDLDIPSRSSRKRRTSPADMLSSSELFPREDRRETGLMMMTSSGGGGGGDGMKRAGRRMLTYEMVRTPTKKGGKILSPPQVQSVVALASPDHHQDDVALVSPPSSDDHQDDGLLPLDQRAGICLLTDLDPSIVNESASSMAFSLSTPTKEGPSDFHHVLHQLTD